MKLENETKTINPATPILYILIVIAGGIMSFLSLKYGVLDNYTVSGVPAKFILLPATILVFCITIRFLILMNKDSSIKISDSGLKIQHFESSFENLVIRRNKLTDTFHFDNGQETYVYKAYLSKKDRDFGVIMHPKWGKLSYNFFIALFFLFLSITSNTLTSRLIGLLFALLFLIRCLTIARIPTEKVLILSDNEVSYNNFRYGQDYYFDYYELSNKIFGFIPIQEEYRFTIIKKDTNDIVQKINCLFYTKNERNNFIRIVKHTQVKSFK